MEMECSDYPEGVLVVDHLEDRRVGRLAGLTVGRLEDLMVDQKGDRLVGLTEDRMVDRLAAH